LSCHHSIIVGGLNGTIPKNLKVLFGPDFKEQEEIEKQLNERGFQLDQGEPLPFNCGDGETVITEVKGTIDKIIFRGIAKIAFNYLAYIEGEDFTLKVDFNDIRRFIRYGEEVTVFRHVIIQNKPILYDEQRLGIQETIGHIVTLSWNPSKTILVSHVTLFNKIIYKITLCKSFSGVYRPIKSGHHFNIESKNVTKLLAFPKNFYIP
jgi:hypothetical protein